MILYLQSFFHAGVESIGFVGMITFNALSNSLRVCVQVGEDLLEPQRKSVISPGI